MATLGEIAVGDTVVSVTDEEQRPWMVTDVNDTYVTAEIRRPGHVPIVAIYRHAQWAKMPSD